MYASQRRRDLRLDQTTKVIFNHSLKAVVWNEHKFDLLPIRRRLCIEYHFPDMVLGHPFSLRSALQSLSE